MKFEHNCRAIAALATLLLLVSGCGGGVPSDTPKLANVTGTVTLDGAPLVDAMVTFTSSDSRTASGTTDAAGKYELMFGPTKGGIIGENVVRITANPKQEHDEKGEVKEVPGAVIPPKYNTESELKATVNAGGNTHNFDLKSN